MDLATCTLLCGADKIKSSKEKINLLLIAEGLVHRAEYVTQPLLFPCVLPTSVFYSILL